MTAPEPDDDLAGYGLLMPFLPVKSKGGPHDDDAFVAGWEMGKLDAYLSQDMSQLHTIAYTTLVHEENWQQTDLLAMRYGFTAKFAEPQDGWVAVRLTRGLGDESDDEHAG